MSIVIYGLICPIRDRLRYVGKAENVERRFKAHLSCRNPNHPKDRWIASLLAKGLQPRLVVLKELGDDDDWCLAEQEAIATALAAGEKLFNRTAGGEGAPLDNDQRAKKTARMRDPETRRKMSEAAKARWADPAKRAAASAANGSPEKRARLSAAATRRATPEYRAMMAQRSKAVWADDQKRKRIEAGITDEVRGKVSSASKRFWATSDNAEICRSNLRPSTPDLLAKAAAARQRPEHKAKMREIWDSPEYRNKLSQALKASWERRRG